MHAEFCIGARSVLRGSGLHKGIVWITEGTWRTQWWQRTDLLTSAHRRQGRGEAFVSSGDVTRERDENPKGY